jgi:hypothetical protein
LKSSDAPYTKPGRLQDVLALIQVLALDENTRRTKDGIEKELQGDPSSAPDWFTLALEHRELFRVNLKSVSPLSLVARYILPQEGEEKRPPLPSDFVSTLIKTAIDLHDRQLQAKEWWKSWISFAAAILAALVGAAVPLITLWLNKGCTK